MRRETGEGVALRIVVAADARSAEWRVSGACNVMRLGIGISTV